MANMLYNGVELPDINSGFQIVSRPYVAIYKLSDGTFMLAASDKPCQIRSLDYATYISPPYNAYKYTPGSTNWEDLSSSNINYVILSTDRSYLPWCNHDIYDDNGNLYSPASTPVPVSAPGMPTSPFEAFMLGQRLRSGLMGVGRKIGGYSYNGTILPKLPEWDRETYPYAYIYSDSSPAASPYYLCINDGGVPRWNGREFYHASDGYGYRYDAINGVWVVRSSGGYAITSHAAASIIWSNYDTLDAYGSLYLAASEPIPVYE